MDCNSDSNGTGVDDFSGFLMPNERIVWSGRPKQGLVFVPLDGLLIPFSIVWGGFALFWEALATGKGAPFPFALFGAVFALVGLYLMFGRFLFDAWIRRRVAYALTNRRILIVRKAPFRKLVSLIIDQLPNCDLVERADGSGTIRFGATTFWPQRGFGSWTPSLDSTPQFLRIGNARAVFDQLQQLIQKGRL